MPHPIDWFQLLSSNFNFKSKFNTPPLKFIMISYYQNLKKKFEKKKYLKKL